MQPSDRFQKLIDHVTRAEDVEAGKRKHICSSLEYFRRQMLADFDRRDDLQKIKSSWLHFQSLMQGSKLFEPFKKDKQFWQGLESSVGILGASDFKEPSVAKRKISAEEFFLSIASSVLREMTESPEKKLLLFGLWYLSVEARLARPFRSQSRIELAYRYIHPRLKVKGFLTQFENDKDVESMVRYFIKGSIY